MIETRCEILDKQEVYNYYSQRNDIHYELKATSPEDYDVFIKIIDYAGYSSKEIQSWEVGQFVSLFLQW